MGIRTIVTRTGKGSALTWDEMDGNLTGLDTDLSTVENELQSKAPLNSPTFTGIPSAPTANPGTNTTQIATTAFVQNAISSVSGITDHSALDNLDYASSGHTGFAASTDSRFPSADEKDALQGTYATPSNSNRYVTDADPRMTDSRDPNPHASTHASGSSDPISPEDIGAAPINSPSFTGTPTAPTPASGTNSTIIATTAFVQTEISNINFPVSFGTISARNSLGGLIGSIIAGASSDTFTFKEGSNITLSFSGSELVISSTASGGTTDHASLSNLDYSNSGHTGFASSTDLTNHTSNTSIHFTESSINHNNIQNIGTYSHTQLDNHVDTTSIHFAETDIDHNNIQNIGTNTHAQIDSHISDSSIHYVESSIDHNNIQNIGTYSHATIDLHIDNQNNPHSVTATQVGKDTAQWNADRILGVPVDDTNKADGNVLAYDSASGSIVYATPSGGSGGGLYEYTAASYSNCFIVASGPGVDFTWTDGTPQVGAFTIPAGVTLYQATFRFTSNGQRVEVVCHPGNSSDLTFRYPSVTIWNASADPRVIESFAVRKDSTVHDRIWWVGSSNGAEYVVNLITSVSG